MWPFLSICSCLDFSDQKRCLRNDVWTRIISVYIYDIYIYIIFERCSIIIHPLVICQDESRETCQISISSSDRLRSDTSHDLILEHSWCRQEVGWFISQGFSWDVVGCLTCTVYIYICVFASHRCKTPNSSNFRFSIKRVTKKCLITLFRIFRTFYPSMCHLSQAVFLWFFVTPFDLV